MARVAGYFIEADKVFRDGIAFCPEHDKPLRLIGLSSNGSSIEVRMTCPESLHSLIAEFRVSDAKAPVCVMFRIRYAERD